jgi:MraZ protein
MFYGTQQINMDAKGRVAIPTRTRELLADSCDGEIIITASTENRCLVIYPKPEWDERILPKLEKLPMHRGGIIRKTKLTMMGYAESITLEDNGRFLIPGAQRTYAGFDKRLNLVGLGTSLELWSEEVFNEVLTEEHQDPTAEELALLDF